MQWSVDTTQRMMEGKDVRLLSSESLALGKERQHNEPTMTWSKWRRLTQTADSKTLSAVHWMIGFLPCPAKCVAI